MTLTTTPRRVAGSTEIVKGEKTRQIKDELSQKYHGQDYNPDDIKSERVMLWIDPGRQTITNQSEGV